MNLPDIGFVRLPQILAVIPVCRATWWAGVKSGRFPAGVLLGPRTRAWSVESIRSLIAEMMTIEEARATSASDAHESPKRENPCLATWGNCSKDKPAKARYWGPPSETPHACSGPRRHLYKQHICQACGMLGARIQPSPYSKAGAQLRAAMHLVAAEVVKANPTPPPAVCDAEMEALWND